MENKRIQVKVRVIKIFASKEDGWCSFRAEDDNGKQYRFAGTVGTAPEVNALYEIEAEEQKSKFGIQYKIIRAELGLPETIAGIFEYLASGHIKGIGKVTAKKLVDRFGNETLNIIHNSPDKLLEIRGISQKKLDQIIISSEENRSIEDIYRITYGAVTKLQAKKLYDTYGKDTVKKLREDPYKTLCQLDGIGFLKADKVALGCGVDLCVLTLQRKRGVACLSTLNRMIQEAYNPAREGVPEYKMQDYIFRVGDRVIHLKNNYSMVRTQRDGTAVFGVFNGDLGIIEKFNPEYLTDQDGENTNESEDEPWVLMVRFDDGSSAVYKETDLLQLELAYAMTTHKAQGSEFKYVIGTFAMDQYTMLSRAIVYTSVTRAKLKYTSVCEKKAFAMAIRNVGSSKRNTFLPELMTENHMST